MLVKIISGGQSGADRGALDAAIRLGIPHGGWVPKGRAAEDGIIDDRYDVQETATDNPSERTELNVKDSDATLLIARGNLTGGTALTRELAQRYNRPWLVLNPSQMTVAEAADRIAAWLASAGPVRILNVAGPRQSEDSTIYEVSFSIVTSAMEKLLRR